MAIQMRRGAYLDFDPSRMLPGEIAVVLSGDDTTDTGKGIYICFSAGDVQRLSTYEEIVREINDALADAPEMAEMVTNAVNAALIAHPEWTTTVQDGAVTVAKLNSNVTTFTEASSRTNIASGDSITTLWGKIKKWFTDLKAVAFSGAYSDLTGTPTLGGAASQAVANNLTTSAAGSVLDARQGKLLGDQLYHAYTDIVTLTPAANVSFARNRSMRIGDFIMLNFALTTSAQIASQGAVFSIANTRLDASCDIVASASAGSGSAVFYLRASDSVVITNGVLPAGTYFCSALIYAPKAS